MSDPRHVQLAKTLIHYSCDLQPGEHILIEAVDIPDSFTCELIKQAHAAGAHPNVFLKSKTVMRQLLMEATDEQLDAMAITELAAMEQVDAYIGMRGAANVFELSDVPGEAMERFEKKIWQRVHTDIRVAKTKWVVLRWPTPSMAQLSGKSTERFDEFYFRVCTMDYGRMSEALKPLLALVEKTDRVRIVSPGTELTFSIAGIPAQPCDGKHNIPDGEVYTAPVRDSINGVIQYNTPTLYQGVSHENVFFRFEDGKIVEATSSNSEHLNRVLDSDEGARYIGEFAIGFNPYVTEPMLDILFDEKIAGSFHFTPGQAYEEADNQNKSSIHWDIVCLQDVEHGGGEIYFDGTLIRKDGLFVVDDLEGLNPENLKG